MGGVSRDEAFFLLPPWKLLSSSSTLASQLSASFGFFELCRPVEAAIQGDSSTPVAGNLQLPGFFIFHEVQTDLAFVLRPTANDLPGQAIPLEETRHGHEHHRGQIWIEDLLPCLVDCRHENEALDPGEALELVFDSCGEPNAYYQSDGKRIVICSELAGLFTE